MAAKNRSSERSNVEGGYATTRSAMPIDAVTSDRASVARRKRTCRVGAKKTRNLRTDSLESGAGVNR